MTKERSDGCKASIKKLQSKGLTIPQIAKLLSMTSSCGSIDRRTIYRWLNGETSPQKTEHVERLEELVKQL
jgi:hypothetical protein